MARFIIYVTLFTLSTIFSVVNAQNKAVKPCSSPEYSQFDFWVGNWNVYDTKNNLIGTNNIIKLSNACAIQENWVSKTSKSKGTSYNYYNKSDNSWNQLWIDNTGFSLDLKGHYDANRMILKSKLIKSQNGDFYNQITWTKNPDGSVTQIWDYVDKNHQKIKEVFKGIYKKQEN
ncbi:hypothetical protein [uncultured Tenacibaculum sp.]|uniref:hypothetical protein n=1 Tax=uncultured Tenacibaculum sp. TaxID=174713 RepID=UPI00262A58FA|nr:hypothetical protein [uncultured Tenacibaculum sp.]